MPRIWCVLNNCSSHEDMREPPEKLSQHFNRFHMISSLLSLVIVNMLVFALIKWIAWGNKNDIIPRIWLNLWKLMLTAIYGGQLWKLMWNLLYFYSHLIKWRFFFLFIIIRSSMKWWCVQKWLLSCYPCVVIIKYFTR